MMLAGGVVAGLVGLGTGYLTLRLRGIFFAIATLALAVVLQTLITNWDFVGGSAGVYAIRPKHVPIFGSYIAYMVFLMLTLAVIVVAVSRAIETSGVGLGFVAIRDDEVAAEATGVPTLRLKLLATTLSGAFMGMAGAPLPYYVTFLEPSSAFNLSYAVNSIAMPLIGGTTAWFGPVLGALLLGIAQQVVTVTISSEINLLIVGVLHDRIRRPRAARAHWPPWSDGQAEDGVNALPLFRAERVTKRFGGFVALDNVDFHVGAGERVGLIGPNGSGKSTFVGCASGALRNDAGAVWFKDRRIDRLAPHQRVRAGLVRSFQLPRPFRGLTVADNLRVPLFFATKAGNEGVIDEALEFVGLSASPRGDAPGPDASRLAQARPRSRDRGSTATSFHGRGDGGTFAFRFRLLPWLRSFRDSASKHEHQLCHVDGMNGKGGPLLHGEIRLEDQMQRIFDDVLPHPNQSRLPTTCSAARSRMEAPYWSAGRPSTAGILSASGTLLVVTTKNVSRIRPAIASHVCPCSSGRRHCMASFPSASIWVLPGGHTCLSALPTRIRNILEMSPD